MSIYFIVYDTVGVKQVDLKKNGGCIILVTTSKSFLIAYGSGLQCHHKETYIVSPLGSWTSEKR